MFLFDFDRILRFLATNLLSFFVIFNGTHNQSQHPACDDCQSLKECSKWQKFHAIGYW